jgi:hypothetical protein
MMLLPLPRAAFLLLLLLSVLAAPVLCAARSPISPGAPPAEAPSSALHSAATPSPAPAANNADDYNNIKALTATDVKAGSGGAEEQPHKSTAADVFHSSSSSYRYNKDLYVSECCLFRGWKGRNSAYCTLDWARNCQKHMDTSA